MKSDFHCVEGWSVIGNRWFGVPFQHIIRIVKPQVHAQDKSFMCADGYSIYLSIEELNIEGVLLAYQLNGKLLESELGGPLRLIIPHKYAYKSAMWVTKIQFMAKHKQGYWENRGYS